MMFDAVINKVLLESITQHQSPFRNIQLDGVTGVLLGSIVSEGGRHRFACL
jgi:hypothetical protein